jgi:putative glutamine amidotransferase
MSKPLIGITCGAHKRDTGEFVYGVLPAYPRSVEQAGGLPLLIPPGVDPVALREIYSRLDGVLLTGGGDVDPSRYGMADDGLVHGVEPDRDAVEITVAQWAAAEDKPLLGICRGVQVTNVALGGTLYRDIDTEYDAAKTSDSVTGVTHDLFGKMPRGYEAHGVEIAPDTRLAKILGTSTVKVNTLHHQALRDVAPQLKVVAHAPDGIVEGVELPSAKFFFGVQWHPEEMTPFSEPMRRLFSAFVDAARR